MQEERCTSQAFIKDLPILVGILAPLLMLPVLAGGTKEVKCCYCISSTLTTLLTDALPSQVAGFLPMLILQVLGFPNIQRCYMAPAALRELASVLLVLCINCTSLVTRTALAILEYCGTRMRAILLSCLWATVATSLFLDSTAVVSVMVAIVGRLVTAIQDDVIQAFHQRSLFQKATEGFTAIRRKGLEDALFRKPEDKNNWTNKIAPVHYETNSRSEEPSCQSATPRGSTTTEVPSVELHSPPKQPAFPLKSSLAAAGKPVGRPKLQTSIFEKGKVINPGVASPTPKPSLRENVMRHASSTYMKPGILNDVAFWESQRYKRMERDLIISVTMASFLTSVISLAGNRGNRYFVAYFKMRFGQDVITHTIWWMLMLPVVIPSMIACWNRYNARILHKYDARLNKDAARAIRKCLKKQKSNLGKHRRLELLVAALFVSWLLSRIIVINEDVEEHYNFATRSLMFDYLIVVLLFALPCYGEQISYVVDGFLGFQEIKRNVPWSAIIIYGGSTSMAFAMRNSSVADWLLRDLPYSSNHGRLFTQAFLTMWASLITELVGNVATVSMLLPISVDVALKIPCNPLYFAIPITAASSTTLIFPTSSMAMAIMQERLQLSPVNLVVAGMFFKSIGVVTVLLSVGTVGNVIFTWSKVPIWATVEAINATAHFPVK
ncbi:Na(+)/citrate cotransporter-like isoform X2 [Ornithodoros turicata]|uniref:Na(+)/citrate cotransporter-like isoform X2 n=1 Tax=Ornithodoros turicata TaxID=34597 RepID=UPI00313981FB